MRDTTSFQGAFHSARDIVTRWETEAGLTPAEPQISIGAGILPVLTDLMDSMWRQERAAEAASDE